MGHRYLGHIHRKTAKGSGYRTTTTRTIQKRDLENNEQKVPFKYPNIIDYKPSSGGTGEHRTSESAEEEINNKIVR